MTEIQSVHYSLYMIAYGYLPGIAGRWDEAD